MIPVALNGQSSLVLFEAGPACSVHGPCGAFASGRHGPDRKHPMTQDQLAGKVERLCRELELLYAGEAGWNTTAIDRVANDSTEAEFALAGTGSKHMEMSVLHRTGVSCGRREPVA